MKKAMIAMSGGVDSSVAAYLITQQGYEAIGVTMKLYNNEDIGIKKEKTCCSLDDVEDARSVANRLGIPYYVFNYTDNFKLQVIERFVEAYRNGRTPNPCLYFAAIRPQKKQQKKQQEMLNSMEKGDSVLTTSGFYGVVIDITDDTVIVEFGSNKNCRIPMQKSAIVQIEKAEA